MRVGSSVVLKDNGGAYRHLPVGSRGEVRKVSQSGFVDVFFPALILWGRNMSSHRLALKPARACCRLCKKPLL